MVRIFLGKTDHSFLELQWIAFSFRASYFLPRASSTARSTPRAWWGQHTRLGAPHYRLNQVAQLLGGELISLQVGHDLSLAIDHCGMEGMGEEAFVFPEVHAKQSGHAFDLGHGAGQEVPGVRVGLPDARILGKRLALIVFGIDND